MNYYFLLVVFSCFLLNHVLADASDSQTCSKKSHDNQECMVAYPPIPTTTRVQTDTPCQKDDTNCWCVKATKYTNAVRTQYGKTKLFEVGPKNQLDNAMNYAKKLSSSGHLTHQPLSEATQKVGCKRWIGGENIAYNFETGDVAKACVDQWHNSQGHLENILTDWFEQVVVGVYFDSSGRVYCVQTFSQTIDYGTSGNEDDDGCEAVSSQGSQDDQRVDEQKKGSEEDVQSEDFKNAELHDEGNRSCRCLEVDTDCWETLKEASGNRCNAYTAASKQPSACKALCCKFCESFPTSAQCSSSQVQAICQNM